MNLFKVTYPNGVMEYLHKECATIEAVINEIAGKTLEEATAAGLYVEHMLGMEGGVAPMALDVLASVAPVGQPQAPVMPVIPNAPAMPPADLTSMVKEEATHVEFERESIMQAAETRVRLMREAAVAALARPTDQT